RGAPRAAHLPLLALHPAPAPARKGPGDRTPRVSPPKSRAPPPAVDRHPHHHPSRRALATPAVLLDQRMGGAHHPRWPLRGHGVRPAPEWFYQGVLDRRLVLAIDPAYFALSGGIERWLYRVARKHAGRQRDGWRFELRHLHAKSASLARFSDLALDIRRIVARQPLPGYLLALERHDGRELILMRPTLSTDPVDKLCNPSPAIGISGATDIRISGASLSGLRAHRLPPRRSPNNESGAPKDSKSDSKFFVVGKSS